ncbi:MAG TPA: hypothetical protein VNM92_11645 [Thermoanaerobaculia bacterium]|nr:hypothetical protein [Thermoanaerobaculia bacterium]
MEDDFEEGEYDEQIEQLIMENGMLIHSVINILVRKGILKQEEIDVEMEKLYEEMEKVEDQEETS